MERKTSEYQEWLLNENIALLYNDFTRSNDATSFRSRCLTAVSPDSDLCGIIMMQGTDFSTFESHGVFSNEDFLLWYTSRIVENLTSEGKRLVYYAKKQVQN